MMKIVTRIPRLTWALTCISLLAACGGGGSTSAPSTATKVTLSGVASKGLMANADVKVHLVKADGTLDLSQVLATTTTDVNGNYQLSFDGTQGQPYVVRVSAKADGSTTHVDEVSGLSKALPAGFAMRALVTPSSSGPVTTSATVTPFSEMAVAAAAKATGGITSDNARQASSSVAQLLGFDPTKVAVRKTSDGAASDDEKKLAIMLTAVSKLAADGALGCTTSSTTSDDKARCVVEKLAGSATANSLKLEDNSGGVTQDVSAALGGAVGAVLADDKLRGLVSAGVLTPITSALACSDSNNCSAAAPASVESAISGTKTMLTQLKSDWISLFGGGTTSAASIEASQIKQAFTGVQVPADVWAKDMGAVILGTELHRKAAVTGVFNVARGTGLVNTSTSTSPVTASAIGCTLFEDVNLTKAATSVATGNFIGCAARYFNTSSVTFVGATATTTITEWRHGFTITPVKNASGTVTSYTYQTRARKRVFVNGVTTQNISLPSGIDTQLASAPIDERFDGTYTPTINSGNLSGFSLTGKLPGAFSNSTSPVNGNLPLVNHHHNIDFSGSASADVNTGAVTATATGSIVALDASGATTSTFAVSKGTLNTGSVATGTQPVALDLAFNWTTASATFGGSLKVQDVASDKSGLLSLPGSASLVGVLGTIHSGVTTQVFVGSISGSVTGLTTYDALQPASSSNFYSTDLSVNGTVTAPGRPRLDLTLGTSVKNDGSSTGPGSVNLTYRSFASGGNTPTQVVSVVFSVPTSPLIRPSATLTDLGKNFKVVTDGSSGDVIVLTGDSTASTVGMLDKSKKLLTFIDGSSISLDFGL
jgi:hypothetical protein